MLKKCFVRNSFSVFWSVVSMYLGNQNDSRSKVPPTKIPGQKPPGKSPPTISPRYKTLKKPGGWFILHYVDKTKI